MAEQGGCHGPQIKTKSLCWRGDKEGWAEGCQSRAAEGRLCNSVLQSLHRCPSKIYCSTQCKRGLRSELRPWLRNAVLEKQPAAVEFGEDVTRL